MVRCFAHRCSLVASTLSVTGSVLYPCNCYWALLLAVGMRTEDGDDQVTCDFFSSFFCLRLLFGCMAVQFQQVCIVVSVGSRQPVMNRQLSLRTVSTLLAWAEKPQTGQACSAAEKHTARANVLKVVALSPQEELASFRSRLLSCLYSTSYFLDVLSTQRYSDRVTLRYTGIVQYSNSVPSRIIFSFLLDCLLRVWNSETWGKT